MLLLIIFVLYYPEALHYLLAQERVQIVFKSKTFKYKWQNVVSSNLQVLKNLFNLHYQTEHLEKLINTLRAILWSLLYSRKEKPYTYILSEWEFPLGAKYIHVQLN